MPAILRAESRFPEGGEASVFLVSEEKILLVSQPLLP
jgi:hypothetical protein